MTEPLDTSHYDADTDIAVVGMAGRFAGARDIRAYWQNLRDGVESLTRFTDEELLAAGVDPADLADPNYVPVGAVLPDMEQFDAAFFGFSPREAAIMDPQHRHFLECAWEALENAGHMPERFPGAIGVFGGSGHNAYMPYNLMTNPKLMSSVGFFLVRHTGNDKDFLTTRVSYLLNLKGPSVNVQTACSTSLVAIHLGVQSLLNGECDMALAGGVTIEMPHRHGYLYKEGEILSPDGHCHAFDAGSQGTVFGSGAGIVVLRRLADALKDGDHIHAVIKGSAVNNDGALKVGYMAPSVDGQAQAIAEALAVANVEPETITYVEAHGTGTPVGDPIEVAALTQAFRQGTDKTGYCGIGSVKSNIGHCDTAAGVASFIKVAMALQYRQLPPTLHFKANNPACEFERSPFYVNHTLKPWQPPAGVPRRAGVSSLGVGGTNAHLVLQEAPPVEPSGPSRPWQLFVQSAKSLTALDAASEALAAHLQAHPEIALADAAHTLRVGRQAMKHRRVVVAASAADAAAALRDAKLRVTEQAADGPRSAAFMFAGGGAQYPNMGRGLYDSEPVFRAAVDECLAIVEAKLQPAIRSVLFPPAGQEAEAARRLERPSLALPALLTIQYAQAKLWMSWGIAPAAMIGHSMGEYTAAHLAGVFSLEDALTLVELRGRLFETLPEGGMLSVPMSEDELRPLLGNELSIAAVNGPKLTVASGPVAAIEALQQRLQADEIDAARVRIKVAAHSAMLEPILREFGAFLRGLRMNAPALPFVSNLSGTWITPAEATDPDYWVRHLRSTVHFAEGLEELLKDPSRVLLEVGPGRTLASLARQHPARQARQPVLNSLRHPDEQVADQAFVLGVLGRLWALGTPVDWALLQGDERRLRIELPTYRFDHQRHWVEPGRRGSETAPADRPLHKRKDVGEWFYRPAWKPAALPAPHAAAEPATGQALVFVDELGFGDKLAQRLRTRGLEVVTVRAGKGYRRDERDRFTLNPRTPGHYDHLLATLNAGGRAPQRIYHCWSLTGEAKLPATPAAVEPLQQLGFYSLLRLAQAIGREDLGEPMRIAVVSDHLQRIGAETGLVPAKATLLGPCKVIPCEFSHIRCTSIDIALPAPGSRQEALLLDGLVAELDHDPLHDVVAWRAGERWAQDFEPAPLPAPAQRAPRLRERGTYLVTGGLGGVGLALAEHLAASVKARLVLLGRSGLPARAEWPALLGQPGADAAVLRRVRQVMALEALGAEVLVVAADVTDAAQMKAALRQARDRFGALHGVLHTAGVLDDGVIQLKEEAAAAAVLAPKLQGTLVLESAIKAVQGDTPLDFLVLFSSISAFAGLAGQIDYAAANAFLDAYAQDRFTRDATCTIAVNWSQWQEVGMAAELAHQLGLASDTLADAAGTPVGHPLVERCLLDAPHERVYATRFSTATHWLLSEHRVKGGDALIPGTGYLEIVRAAFTQVPQALPVELKNVTFLAPFAVRASEARELRVHIRAHGTAAHPFSVVSRPVGDGAADQPWTENVRGSVAYVDEPAPAAEPLAEVLARCTVRAQTRFEPLVHLDFGPRWHNLVRIDFGAAEAVLTLELGAAFGADLETCPLHPALLDIATGSAQALVPGFDAARDFYVPASYGSLRMFGPMTRRLASHVRLKPDDHGGDLATYDVTVRDESGRVVLEIRDFTMIRVRDKALLAGGAERPAQAVPAKPRATANNILAVGRRDGILSDEGAQVLERVLAWGAGPQIVVSPQDLIALMAQARSTNAPAAREGEAAATHAEGSFQAPASATEKLIAQMWGDMLGVQRVSASDNFFDLGGHSLLAVQVINKLKKKTGKALPLTALLEAPTVQSLAALIEPPGSAPAPAEGPAGAAAPQAAAVAAPRTNTLIPIRPGTGKLPIFFVHDGNGETLLYRTLALQLDPGHAVYGLQPEMRADQSFVHTTLKDMAAAHLRQVRSVQPQGPYLLAGLCAGGVIAFEMARQLQDVGERALFVGIIDAAAVGARETPFYDARVRLERFVSEVAEGGLREAVPRVASKVMNLVRWQLESRLARARSSQQVRALREQAASVDPATAGLSESALSYLRLYAVAHAEHRHTGVFEGGEVVLFRASQGDGTLADVPFKEKYNEPLMGWARLVRGEVVLEPIPGGHSSALQKPHVDVLSAKLQQHVDRALAQAGPGSAPADAAQSGSARKTDGDAADVSPAYQTATSGLT